MRIDQSSDRYFSQELLGDQDALIGKPSRDLVDKKLNWYYFRQWYDDETFKQRLGALATRSETTGRSHPLNERLRQWERSASHDRPLLLVMRWWIVSRWLLPRW